MAYALLSDKEEQLARAVVNAAYNVHKELGPGLLESVYEVCFVNELIKSGWNLSRQLWVPIHYDGLTFKEALRLDVLIEDMVICEIKAVDIIHPVFEAQLLSYLKLMNKRLGFLINFNVPLIKNGIKRMII